MAESLYKLIQAAYGLRTTVQESVVGATVGVAEGKVIAFNPNRLGFTLINNGGATIYLTPRKGAAVGRGIRLLPAGGSMTLKWDVDFELVASEWYGIADGAASAIYYMEVVAY